MDQPPVLTVSGRIATVTLSRPDVANRMNPSDLRVFADHIEAVNEMKDVLVLRVLSTGKYFCSGFDINAFGAEKTERDMSFGEFVDVLELARPITIAGIQGGVYGGATDMCIACDFRIGVPTVDCFMPAARLGLHYYQGGLERYVSRLGLNAAKRMFLTAEKLDAQTMLDIGFLTEIVAADQLMARVDALAQTLAGMAPIPLLGMKKHLNRIAHGTLDVLDLERDELLAQMSEDLKEGGLAWKEKRKPAFRGV